MARTRIKICGIGRVEDALDAAKAGADAIGLVFHGPSPRNVSLDVARQILAVLPPFLTPVALFVDAATLTIQETCRELGLQHIQLHGHERPEQVKALAPFRVIKALRVAPVGFEGEVEEWKRAVSSLPNLTGFVLETADTKQPGGTGEANNWSSIKQHIGNGLFDRLPPIVVAGGLNPETVGQVVRDLRPFAVDVSSGVECSLGKKSREKIDAFVRAVALADLED